MSSKTWATVYDELSPSARAILLSSAQTIRAQRGQTLLVRGERSSSVYFVLEGTLAVVLYSANGREVYLRELGAGEFFGELAAIDGEDRSANVVALTNARLMAITRDNFFAAIHSCPEVANWILRTLSTQVRSLAEKVLEMRSLNIQARLHSELLRLGRGAHAAGKREVFPAPTHAELANRIGANRESVTREMNALVSRRIIRTGRKRLEFLDIRGLEESLDALGVLGMSGANLREPAC